MSLPLAAVIISILVACGGFVGTLVGVVWFVSSSITKLQTTVESLSVSVSRLASYTQMPEIERRLTALEDWKEEQ